MTVVDARFQLQPDGLWDQERQQYVTTDLEHARRLADRMGLTDGRESEPEEDDAQPGLTPLALRLAEAFELAGIPKRGRVTWLAKRVGVSNPTASCWIKGKHGADNPNVRLMADALGVSFEWLLLGSGAASSDPASRLAVKIRALPLETIAALETIVDRIALVPPPTASEG